MFLFLKHDGMGLKLFLVLEKNSRGSDHINISTNIIAFYQIIWRKRVLVVVSHVIMKQLGQN